MTKLTTLELIRLAASAQFRAMTKTDFEAFAGAPPEALIAQVGDMVIIYAPAFEGEPESFEFVNMEDLEFTTVRLSAEAL